MRQCAEILDLLSGFLDRDLPPGMCREVEKHLESCGECGQAAESLRRTVAMCKEYRAGTMPGPLAESKQQELREAFARVLRDLKS